jgi:hypothetical protein
MAQRLNNSNNTTPETVVKGREQLMQECLRKAEKIRHSLKRRQHTDSTKLIVEDRKR